MAAYSTLLFFWKEDCIMPGLSKKEKAEWDFFIDPRTGRRTYNKLCRNCVYDCKQSHKARVIACAKYRSKRQKQQKGK